MNVSTDSIRSPLGLFEGSPTPRLYDRIVQMLRARHYSPKIEKAYVHWIVRYLGVRSPLDRIGALSFVLTACNDTNALRSAPVSTESSTSPTATATPDYSLPGGAAGICATPAGEYVDVSLEIDVPQPRCAVVRGCQRLRVTNHFSSPGSAALSSTFLPAVQSR